MAGIHTATMLLMWTAMMMNHLSPSKEQIFTATILTRSLQVHDVSVYFDPQKLNDFSHVTQLVRDVFRQSFHSIPEDPSHFPAREVLNQSHLGHFFHPSSLQQSMEISRNGPLLRIPPSLICLQRNRLKEMAPLQACYPLVAT